MANFIICNLEGDRFTFEGFTFERLSGYEDGRKTHDSSEHYQTFHAIADDDLVVKPLIHAGDILAVIDDLCLLLSLIQSRHIYCPKYEMGGQITHRSVFIPGKPKGNKIILENKLEVYLSTAANIIRQDGWTEKTGFIPALYFIVERNYPEFVEFQFISAWIALEILARAFCTEKGISSILVKKTFNEMVKPVIKQAISNIEEINLPINPKTLLSENIPSLNQVSIRNLINELKTQYKLDFFSNKLLTEYIKVRNGLMHSGAYGMVDKKRVGELSIRLEASVRLVLISLLCCSDYVHDKYGWKVWITQEK